MLTTFCHVVNEGCTNPPGWDDTPRICTCQRCGNWVCQNCSTIKKMPGWTIRHRTCARCIEDEREGA